MKIRTSTGIEFAQQHGQTLLDASIEAGYPINHSCRSGRCGFCKVRVISGESLRYRREELSATDIQQDYILSCARSATTDMLIDAGQLEQVLLPRQVSIPCAIASLSLIHPDLLKVSLLLPLVARLDYLPGQYVRISNRAGVSGAYALASAAPIERMVDVYIMRSNDAMSDYWFSQATAGELLTVQGPYGNFYLRDVSQRRLLLIANRGGMPAIRALLQAHAQLPEAQQAHSLELLWLSTTAEQIYLTPAELTAYCCKLSILPAQATLAEYLQSRISKHIADTSIYASAPTSVLQQLNDCVQAMGLVKQHVFANDMESG